MNTQQNNDFEVYLSNEPINKYLAEVVDITNRSIANESSWMILRKALQHGFTTIYDEINITKENRKKVIDLVKDTAPDCKIICVWFRENEKNLERRMQDSRGVPEHRWSAIIDEMRKEFEVPTIEEGFHEIVMI